MPPVEAILRFVAAALIGYLLGCTPSGVVVGKLFGGVDPRTQGSGKTGATNVLRTLGPGPALLVVLLDVGKGVAAVLIARYLIFPPSSGASVNLQAWGEAVGAFCAMLGHNYSMYLHFRGGRGVATGGGGILAMSPIALAVALVALIVPIVLTRYVSLGSMLAGVAAAVTDVILCLTGNDRWPHAIFMIVGAAFIIYSHSDNIQRLRTGTERKLGQPKA